MPSFRILQPESYKLRIANMWEGRGKNYDASDTFHQALATRLVNIAKPQAGQNVIDIATGTGMVAVAVARKLGKSGHVTGVDISESMLAEVNLLIAYCVADYDRVFVKFTQIPDPCMAQM